jgi:tRNA U34 5-methylaminomethyl-2-thiouridine-forming methyltransferase MnmC
MDVELFTTNDGSDSLYNRYLDETYHSRHGAIQEAKVVFIEAGLKHLLNRSTIRILEVGFGTGLNAWLSCLEVYQRQVLVDYTGIEAFPLESAMINALNYSSQIKHPKALEFWQSIHRVPWEKSVSIYPKFTLKKVRNRVQEFQDENGFDAVFFDAFAPRVQPEMWEFHVFEKLAQLMNSGGILVTYSAKGSVRRDLIALGYSVERLPGPPGKREMMRAIKQ